MKKQYLTPELLFIKIKLKDVLSASPTESTINDIIGGGEGGEGGELIGEFDSTP